MREQRTANLTLNSVSDILKLISLFTVFSQKVTLSNVVNKIYSGWIRILVAMATYSFHRLTMGKVEIGNFYYLIGDIRNLFYRYVY